MIVEYHIAGDLELPFSEASDKSCLELLEAFAGFVWTVLEDCLNIF